MEPGPLINDIIGEHGHPAIDVMADEMTDEQWCVSYLFTLRWPDGFICPFCRSQQPEQLPSKQVVCRCCGRLSTVTSGTLMHGSKKGLNCWFRAIWWLISNATAATARGLQRELGFAGYQTAWAWMNKLRSALQELTQERIGGTVAVGAGVLPGEQRVQHLHHVLVAVESIAEGRLSGMVRAVSVDSVDIDTVAGFIRGHVLPGSVVVMPECEPFISAVEMESYLFIFDGGNSNAVVLEEVKDCLRSWYGRRKYQPVNRRRLQEQLNEFCFTQTALLCRNKKELFDRVLMGAVGHGPKGGGR